MIKHHPTAELLKDFVEGELPASLAAAIAIHSEKCTHCQQTVNDLTIHEADKYFNQPNQNTPIMAGFDSGLNTNIDMDSMIDAITSSEEIDLPANAQEKAISVKGKQYILPRALSNMAMSKWTSIGNLARARFSLDEGQIHASLLQIQAGGSIPEHTHKGFELTLLLDGHFKDEMGEYGPGDFILLGNDHHHSPTSEKGCLCYTVLNDALHFTQGINKLLNPIGSFIY